MQAMMGPRANLMLPAMRSLVMVMAIINTSTLATAAMLMLFLMLMPMLKETRLMTLPHMTAPSMTNCPSKWSPNQPLPLLTLLLQLRSSRVKLH